MKRPILVCSTTAQVMQLTSIEELKQLAFKKLNKELKITMLLLAKVHIEQFSCMVGNVTVFCFFRKIRTARG